MDIHRKILLTIDLEEFDLPLEYGINIPFEEQMHISDRGVEEVTALFEKYEVQATFFVTLEYALANKQLIENLSQKHEIASHSQFHNKFNHDSYSVSKQVLEEIIKGPVYGFRMPRFAETDYSALKHCGYEYDSSVNPAWVPGRYNNLATPRTYYLDKSSGLPVLPASVSPLLRIPLFWLSFKNLPFSVYSHLCRQTLQKDGYLHLYFHVWEFSDIDSYKVPFYIKRICGKEFTGRFERLLMLLGSLGEYSNIYDFMKSRGIMSKRL